MEESLTVSCYPNVIPLSGFAALLVALHLPALAGCEEAPVMKVDPDTCASGKTPQHSEALRQDESAYEKE